MLTKEAPKKSLTSLVSTDSMKLFKKGVDDMLAKRAYFMEHVFPKLKEGFDYHIIKGKKSCSKGGAEKIANVFGYSAFFEQDEKMAQVFSSVKDIVCIVCTLYDKNGNKVGMGRAAASLLKNENDPNKTIKMAEKSAFISSVIRTAGLGDTMTADLEDMNLTDIKDENEIVEDLITVRQHQLLVRLINESMEDSNERQTMINSLDEFSKVEASTLIGDLINKRDNNNY